MEPASKIGDILGSTVGQCGLCLGPNELIRVEFRCIRWKPMHFEPWNSLQKLFDEDPPVNASAIPEEDNGAAEVPQKVSQKSNNLHAGDVGRVEAVIEAESSGRGRDGNSGDCGNSIALVAVSEDRRFSDGSPCLAGVGNEEEPALVEKSKVGATATGFFLSVTTCASSTWQWLLRLFGWHVVPVSATSTAILSSLATSDRGGSGYRNAFRSVWLFGAASTGRSNTPLPKHLAPRAAAVCPSASLSNEKDVPAPVLIEVRWPLLVGNSGPIEQRSLSRSSPLLRLIGTCFRHGAALLPVAFLPPAFGRVLGVSCLMV